MRIILRQLLALPCKLLSGPSAADIATHFSRHIMSEEEGDVPITRADFKKLFFAILMMEGKVVNLKQELAEEQEAANERLANCMKLDKAPMFKKKAHEKQYCFNETMMDKVQEAQAAQISPHQHWRRQSQYLPKVRNSLMGRQKQIRIADRSEYGLATVEEYLDDELTDNSDNEKHMYKVELHAGRKRTAPEAAKNQKVKKGATARAGFAQYPVRGDSMALANPQAIQAASIQRTIAPASVSSLGPYFQCGKLGHFRRVCPLLQSATGVPK